MTTNTLTPPRTALKPEQIRHFHDQGYVILRGVFTADEIAAASDEADALLARPELFEPHNLRTRFTKHAVTSEALPDVLDPVFDVASVLRGLGQSRRMLDALSCLFGEPAHQFKEKLIYRAPGATGATLHQDWIAWPSFPKSYTASIIALDRFGEDNGCTRVYPGNHKHGPLFPLDGEHHPLKVEQLPLKESVPLLLEPGDVAVFGGFTPHSSEPNRSDRWRRGLFVSYNADSHGGEQREAHYAEYNLWRKSRRPVAEQPHLFFA